MTAFPPTDDPLVAALQRLLARHGGHIHVADAAGVSDQSLYQIAYKKPHSKTGNPKSVGPHIRRKLDAAFPGWLDAAPSQAESAPQAAPAALTIGQALRLVAEAVKALPRQERTRLQADWAAVLSAPDSAELLASIQTALQPPAPPEANATKVAA